MVLIVPVNSDTAIVEIHVLTHTIADAVDKVVILIFGLVQGIADAIGCEHVIVEFVPRLLARWVHVDFVLP